MEVRWVGFDSEEGQGRVLETKLWNHRENSGNAETVQERNREKSRYRGSIGLWSEPYALSTQETQRLWYPEGKRAWFWAPG